MSPREQARCGAVAQPPLGRRYPTIACNPNASASVTPPSGIWVARFDDIELHGVDMLAWNDRDQVTGFTFMVSPIRALERLVVRMREELTRMPS